MNIMLPRVGYLMSVWRCARLDINSMLDVQTSLLEKCTHFYWHVPKNLSQNAPIFITCTYCLIGSAHPGTATEFLAANIFQPISGQHCLLRHPSGRYAQRNQSLQPKMPPNFRSTTDSDENVTIPVSEWVSEWVYMWGLFHFFSSSRLCECECACICVASWKEHCPIIALFSPCSMCDEIKYV